MCVLVALAREADAEPLLDLSGRVQLLDSTLPNHVRVTLGIDLDRNGVLNTFEQAEAIADISGSYAVTYEPEPELGDLEFGLFVAELLVAYQERGFEALLDDGPLPVSVRFEQEGYSTIVERFTTLSGLPSLDVVLAPLSRVHCGEDGCMTPDGSVHVSGFPGGTSIDRMYARAGDPIADRQRFPGFFTDSADNLLLSSGFVELNPRNYTAANVRRLSSPVTVRFRADPRSWASLRDLEASSNRIEVPMYSFDETRGAWVPEPPGELQSTDGAPVDEGELAALHAGTYTDPVFVSFQTDHFSTFNCDAPAVERACVQGRLVTAEGEGVGGVHVSVEGVSYTGSAGSVFTGSDGYFATDVMKSEADGEDVDGNGRSGETFQARVIASGSVGVFRGEPFETPVDQGSTGSRTSCRPPGCDCVDLGAIEARFELPRPCEVTVRASFSGRHLTGRGGPLETGDALVDVKVTGELVGGPWLPLDDAVCGGSPCNFGQTAEDGSVSFVVPVVGDAPVLDIRSEHSVEVDGALHFYTGSTQASGCARDEATPSASVELEVDHAALEDLGDFIEALGPGPQVPSGSGGSAGSGGAIPGVESAEFRERPSCACRDATGARSSSPFGLLAAWLIAMGTRSRRRSTRALASSEI